MADATVYGIDINALVSVAGAQAQGSQKARFCSDIATLLGSNAIFRIKVGGTTKYQSTVVGALSSSSAGIAMPLQFVEPPSTNVADALTAADALIEVSNASNSTIRITVPVKAGGASGFLTASAALDGTKLFRTSGVLLTPPASLDASVGGGSTSCIYLVSTLVADMTTANTNSWHLDSAPTTANNNGPGGTRYAQVNLALRRADGNSHWPGAYLDDDSYDGRTWSSGSTIRRTNWYVVGRAYQVTNQYSNIRVQLRNYKLLGLKTDNTWEEIDAVDDNLIQDTSWHASFSSPGNEIYRPIGDEIKSQFGGELDQIQTHASGDGGGQSLGSIGYGSVPYTSGGGQSLPKWYKWTNHGYPSTVYKTRSQWTGGYHGLLVVMEGRLILHGSGADNRASCGLMVWMGADWYLPSAAPDDYLQGCYASKIKLLTNDWQIFSAHDLTQAQLEAYPPPGYS